MIKQWTWKWGWPVGYWHAHYYKAKELTGSRFVSLLLRSSALCWSQTGCAALPACQALETWWFATRIQNRKLTLNMLWVSVVDIKAVVSVVCSWLILFLVFAIFWPRSLYVLCMQMWGDQKSQCLSVRQCMWSEQKNIGSRLEMICVSNNSWQDSGGHCGLLTGTPPSPRQSCHCQKCLCHVADHPP